MTRQRILVTGASGFVGGAVVKRLLEHPELYDVVAAGRSERGVDSSACRVVSGLELSEPAGWAEALQGVDVVIHCAARAHVMNDTSLDPLAEFRRVNVDGALNLAAEASKQGVKRLVFVSTVKVNGESTNHRAPFRETDEPRPRTHTLAQRRRLSGSCAISASKRAWSWWWCVRHWFMGLA